MDTSLLIEMGHATVIDFTYKKTSEATIPHFFGYILQHYKLKTVSEVPLVLSSD